MNSNIPGPWDPDQRADQAALANADQWTQWLKTFQRVG